MNFEQRTQLEKLTQLKMDYTEVPRNCANCAHATFDDYSIYCSYSNICMFKTVDHASCAKFEEKKKQDGTIN